MNPFTYFLILLIFGAQQAFGATFEFSVDPVTSCEYSPNSVCEPVTEYRIYDVTDGNAILVMSSSVTVFEGNYPAETNVTQCFVATAYNGLESEPTQEVCVTPTVSRPDAPSVLEVFFY
jgi:hypothetical protein